MKLMNLLTIVLVIFLAAGGCSGIQETKKIEDPAPSDTLVEMLTAKKTGHLKSVLSGILKNGSIIKRTIDAQLINKEYESVIETWVVEDSGGNRHIVVIRNGILTSISEDKAEASQPTPMGGWQKN